MSLVGHTTSGHTAGENVPIDAMCGATAARRAPSGATMSTPANRSPNPSGRRVPRQSPPITTRVARGLAVLTARAALPLQFAVYASGLDMLCQAAQSGLTALRRRRRILERRLHALPPAAHVHWAFDEHGEQFEIPSQADDLETEIEMATDAMNELRKAFAIAAYHHWERSVLEWWHAENPAARDESVPEERRPKPPQKHGKLQEFAENVATPPAPALDKVRTLANALKHNSKDRWDNLAQQWPEVIARKPYQNRANWAGTIRLSDSQLLKVFQADLPRHVDRLSRERLAGAGRDQDSLRRILSTARFPAGIPLHLAPQEPDGPELRPNRPLADGLTLYLEARAAAAARLGRAADDPALQIGLELGPEPVFVAWLDQGQRAPEAAAPAPPPLGQPAAAVRRWFEATVSQAVPDADDRLETARAAARAYAQRAAAPNTLRAYRASIRAWCAWSARHALPCLPARGPDIAAFLAAERGRGLSPTTLDLRRAALTYLHRLADCPVPTQDSAVAATQAGIRRDAAARGHGPKPK
uniref:Core-binding (CB) domain-containing protein n=1 Tax=Anopheles maculatus TaxID=74869 RepID=A0A182SSZ1_9DIPT